MTTALNEPEATCHDEYVSRKPIHAALTLVALPSAVSCAQIFVRYNLGEWDIDSADIEVVELLVSELVTSAVEKREKAGSPATHPDAPSSLIAIRMRITRPMVVVEIWDSSATASTDSFDAGGRHSLLRMRSMSTPVNYYRPGRGGMTAWFELNICGAVSDTNAGRPALPRRTRSREPVRQPAPIAPDLALLTRVLEGLRAL